MRRSPEDSMTIFSDGDRIRSKIFLSQPVSNKTNDILPFSHLETLAQILAIPYDKFVNIYYPYSIRRKIRSNEMTDVNVNGNWVEGVLFVSPHCRKSIRGRSLLQYWHRLRLQGNHLPWMGHFSVVGSTTCISSTPTNEKMTLSPSDTKTGQRTTEQTRTKERLNSRSFSEGHDFLECSTDRMRRFCVFRCQSLDGISDCTTNIPAVCPVWQKSQGVSAVE